MRRVFVPGNHDISRQYIKFATLNALAHADDDETNFNNLIYTEYRDIIYPKFGSYFSFATQFSGYGCGQATFCGAGHDVGEDIGIYTLNTALFSFGGMVDPGGHAMNDEGLLRIETRRLNRWLQETSFRYRILVMHHPVDHLTGWAKTELDRIIRRSFDLVLQGHIHRSDACYLNTGTSQATICTAPPLFTRKAEILGYTLISVDTIKRSVELCYRQTSGSLNFVTGSFFTGTDDGRVRLGSDADGSPDVQHFAASQHSSDATLDLLRARFLTATTCHSSLGPLWVAPDIGTLPETEHNKEQDPVSAARDLLSHSDDLIIKAPPQFGLTSLGHFLALEAWLQHPGSLYLMVTAEELPNHESGVRQAIQRNVETLGTSLNSLSEIIVDNILLSDKLHIRKINSIKRAFPTVRLILMFRIDNQDRIGILVGTSLETQFHQRYIWSLDRPKIRELVRQYCAKGCQLDEDALTQRVIDDLRVVNLYRTPFNCITLMRIADAMFDHSPINRTEMIERFLFLIFTDFARLPKYGNVPDLKDSTYALAHLCEVLLRRNDRNFGKTEFFDITRAYCKEKVIDLDVDILFACSVNENILVHRDGLYRFRFAHWILFFAAQRMYHDADFANFVLESRRYARFPEIIEFYSGIDRRRTALLERLRDDLRALNRSVNSRVNISENFNPYDFAGWNPSDEQVTEMQKDIDDEVARSGLPTSIKDQLADRNYDRGRPYRQELIDFIETTSLYEAMQVMRAAATALRNSDHVDGPLKAELWDEVITTWLMVLKLCILLTPLLVRNRIADFENVRFVLVDYEPERDPTQYMMSVLSSLPRNVVDNFEKELASRRMAPLFFDFVQRSETRTARLMMVMCVLRYRPRGWITVVKHHILSEDRNSVYLAEVYRELRQQLAIGFVSEEERFQIRELVGVALARHAKGAKNPSSKMVEAAAKAVLDDVKQRQGRKRPGRR